MYKKYCLEKLFFMWKFNNNLAESRSRSSSYLFWKIEGEVTKTITNDDICLPFYLLFMLCYTVTRLSFQRPNYHWWHLLTVILAICVMRQVPWLSLRDQIYIDDICLPFHLLFTVCFCLLRDAPPRLRGGETEDEYLHFLYSV